MIRFDKVNQWYGPHLQVLNEITAEVNKGEVVVLCGPSGSGKTTLIRTINRLEPIDSGTIIVNGQEDPFQSSQRQPPPQGDLLRFPAVQPVPPHERAGKHHVGSAE